MTLIPAGVRGFRSIDGTNARLQKCCRDRFFRRDAFVNPEHLKVRAERRVCRERLLRHLQRDRLAGNQHGGALVS